MLLCRGYFASFCVAIDSDVGFRFLVPDELLNRAMWPGRVSSEVKRKNEKAKPKPSAAPSALSPSAAPSGVSPSRESLPDEPVNRAVWPGLVSSEVKRKNETANPRPSAAPSGVSPDRESRAWIPPRGQGNAAHARLSTDSAISRESAISTDEHSLPMSPPVHCSIIDHALAAYDTSDDSDHGVPSPSISDRISQIEAAASATQRSSIASCATLPQRMPSWKPLWRPQGDSARDPSLTQQDELLRRSRSEESLRPTSTASASIRRQS